MKKAIVVLLTLVIVLVLVPPANTNPDNSSYDPMADVSRDGVIDIYDLARLGEAYGTTQTVPTIPNQTVVYVYQIEKDPAEVQNARVAVAELPLFGGSNVVQVSYTNSSGTANFTLSPNVNYTAIAWSNKTYSYANFTTNEYGEASAIIQLGFPHLPQNWVVTTVVNMTSGALVEQTLVILWKLLIYDPTTGEWQTGMSAVGTTSLGVFFSPPEWGINEPGHWIARAYLDGHYLAEVGFTPDENGSAFVVIYV